MKKNYFFKFFFILLVGIFFVHYWILSDSTNIDDRLDTFVSIAEDMNARQEFLTLKKYDSSEIRDAEILCLSWAKQLTGVNCFTGDVLPLNKFATRYYYFETEVLNFLKIKNRIDPDQYKETDIWAEVFFRTKIRLDRLKSFKNHLINSNIRSVGLESVIYSLDDMINELSMIQSSISPTFPEKGASARDEYKKLFFLTLSLEGLKYQDSTGKFNSIGWNIARVFDDSSVLKARIYRLKVLSFLLPFFIFVPMLLIFYNYSNYLSVIHLALITGVSLFMATGLLVAFDASNNFGINSQYFTMSPLSGVFERQTFVVLMGYAAIIIGIYLAQFFSEINNMMGRKFWKISIILLAGIFFSYFFISPAIGSEFLKVTTVILAAIFTNQYSREIFLIQKYSPESLSFNMFFQSLKITDGASLKKNLATLQISRHILVNFLSFAIISILAIFIASFLFSDFGGSFIGMLILITACFLVFGLRLAAISLLFVFFLSFLLLQTNKVSDRVTLMLEPMRASVSDFARLLGFVEGLKDKGVIIGKIPWCSAEGICLPLQILSDYLPILFQAIFGTHGSLIIFFLLLGLFIYILLTSLYWFILENPKNKFSGILIFYLASSAILQILLSFFGNWRLIPLSGISLPFLSIGISSMFLPCLTIGLFLGIHFLDKKKND
ncbi:MAG: hypothetical protein CBC42_04180 [Betaproteobacteria bacterium TMED82]|nr:MAG: hypothetical protein CBC42_04180 [Betaproteobacteria bacterium TMED82]|tara:strand:- start:4004 stop:6001 length:1998 start_codon:yes stop_codon:yes gene_type:complete